MHPSSININAVKTANPTKNHGGKRVLGFDLHWWEGAMVVSLWCAAAIAAFVGFATGAVVILQRASVKEASDALEKYKKDAGVEIAEANARAEEAKSVAAKANEVAEHERLERVKLEGVIAPRRIPENDKSLIIGALRPFARRHVVLSSYAGDAESALLGFQLLPLLQAAGLVVDEKLMTTMPFGSVATGINVTAGPDKALALGIATAIGKNSPYSVRYFSETPPGQSGIFFGNSAPEPEAQISVGPKPIPDHPAKK
jgi:hypothetical protein